MEVVLRRETASGWWEYLLGRGYVPITIHSMLSAVNRFLKLTGRGNCKIKFLRVQRKSLREQSKNLTSAEYHRLLDTAQARGTRGS